MKQGGVTPYNPEERAEIETALELFMSAEARLPFAVLDVPKHEDTSFQMILESNAIRMACIAALGLSDDDPLALNTPLVSLVATLAARYTELRKAVLALKDAA